MKAAPDVSRMKAAPDVSRMKAAPDVSRKTAAPVLLVLLLLCVCEVGVGGAQESPPSQSDVMKEVKVLRGMMVDMRGDNAVNAARCSCQKQLDTLQSNMSSRLSAGEAKMGEVIEAKMGEVIEAKMGEVIEKLQKHKENELVKDNLAKLTERYCSVRDGGVLYVHNQTIPECTMETLHYGDLESSNHQLQTQFDQLQARYNETIEQKDQLQSSYQQLNSTCNPVPVPKRLKRLCESDGFKWDGGVCYYYSSTESKTWDQSRGFCLDRQADLIIINSQEKKDLVDRVVVPSGTYVWIGFSDRETEGSYTWVDRKPLSSPTFWWPDYGTPREAKDCGAYSPPTGWWDGTCSNPYQWMCERVVQ